MKRLLPLLVLLLIVPSTVFANGVAVYDATYGKYLRLLTSSVDVTVENQVAVVTATHTFINEFSSDKAIKYVFPMPEGASATNLLWHVNGVWKQAAFEPVPQDTSLPGSGSHIDPALKTYMGNNPVYFEMDDIVYSDSIITVQLTYVQLLPYSFGKVSFYYPNDYTSIQPYPLEQQHFSFALQSERTIDEIRLTNHTANSYQRYDNYASISYIADDEIMDTDIGVEYELSADEFGLFGLSTMLPDTLVPDNFGDGYFLFVAEPNPDENTQIIDKNFTLVIDRSGSMNGEKMVQAKNAAIYILDHLNPGDKFNIVDFATNVSSYKSSHQTVNTFTILDAKNYVNNLKAAHSTNISGALEETINQFSRINNDGANIIIFFTDGEATVGLLDTDDIVQHVNSTRNEYGTDLSLFTFGIGANVNKQLLTLLATDNDGLVDFLENDELETKITAFYNKIRNPVLLDTQLDFGDYAITELYPNPLPDLYVGQQLIVAGRYGAVKPNNITLSGKTFGKYVSYNYNLDLAGSTIEENSFLTKIWAKMKIEHLLIEYYKLEEDTREAQAIRHQIVEVSVQYGVLSPFTSLSDNDDIVGIEDDNSVSDGSTVVEEFELIGNFPNPFNPSTTITFKVHADLHEVAVIKIYNALGQLVRTLMVGVNGSGVYDIRWNGIMSDGAIAPSGRYIYTITLGNKVLAGKMMLLK